MQEDNLFKFKLWALETDLMKASSKSAKSKLRRAKTTLEAFTVMYDVKSKGMICKKIIYSNLNCGLLKLI